MTLSITFINGKKEKEKEKEIDITIEYDNYPVDNVPREREKLALSIKAIQLI